MPISFRNVVFFWFVFLLLFLNTGQKALFNIHNITVFPAVRSHLDKSLQPINLLATSVVVLIVSEQGNCCSIVNQPRERLKQSWLSLAGLQSPQKLMLPNNEPKDFRAQYEVHKVLVYLSGHCFRLKIIEIESGL